jgi:ABC-type sugar transport system substrate-binding protein
MTTLKTVTLAAALIAGATSLAMAQSNGMPPSDYKGPGAYQSYKSEDFQQGNTGANAAASGGSGTHSTSQRTGSAQNTQKVLRNQQGYRTGSYRIYSSANCHLVRHPATGRLMRVCR